MGRKLRYDANMNTFKGRVMGIDAECRKETNALIQPEWKNGIITKSTVRRPLAAEYEVTCAIRDTVYLDFISNLKAIVNDSCDMHAKFLLKNQCWWDQFQQQVDSLLE